MCESKQLHQVHVQVTQPAEANFRTIMVAVPQPRSEKDLKNKIESAVKKEMRKKVGRDAVYTIIRYSGWPVV